MSQPASVAPEVPAVTSISISRLNAIASLPDRFHFNALPGYDSSGHNVLGSPDQAAPGYAADLLVGFLQDKQAAIEEALLYRELPTVRRLVNGGTHGLERFIEAYQVGDKLLL